MDESRLLLLFLILGFLLLEFVCPLRRQQERVSWPRVFPVVSALLHGLCVAVLLLAFGSTWSFASAAGMAFALYRWLLGHGVVQFGAGVAAGLAVELIGNLLGLLVIWLTNEHYWLELPILLKNTLTLELLVIVLAYIAMLQPASRIIAAMLQPWMASLTGKDDGSLKNAGALVGYLERSMILTFVLLQQWEAVGFLLTAKSILRFNEVKGANHHARSEYILLGTLLSFSISIGAGLMTLLALGKSLA
ncbi:hypothetical protein [Metapseudomonas furukawaii]|mgnify:CR=1 FL=1|jgi:hypothetical protein|uniref:Transmembrane protein n=1 Tax=Metapseudomonas furukawaii TaxID=1149133 RepID=A0AAD1FIK0_METFU|nr:MULTISPECIES: hypothetical protein [Pseudomonas]OWJ96931.1 hypothetical protein B6S59_05630 [Pseudomonas sp. A46]BAU76768.1 hypothetical protein KF707C_50800 [Pseudomonas furukawaii]